MFWLDLSVFSYWTLWILKANIQVLTLNILSALACKKISKNLINKSTEGKYFLIDKQQG